MRIKSIYFMFFSITPYSTAYGRQFHSDLLALSLTNLLTNYVKLNILSSHTILLFHHLPFLFRFCESIFRFS